VTIGGGEHRRLHVRINNYDPTLSPAGKTVLTAMIDSDYDYWKELKKDPDRYKREKDLMAAAVVSMLEGRFPGISKQVEMVDVATPVTFERYTGNWKGCYEGFLTTPKTQRMQMSKTLPGLDGFYMVGQWVSPGGGLPSGVMTGRHVTQLLCKRDGRRFTTSLPA
jgi:phytoene dehydrogenase-like protein